MVIPTYWSRESAQGWKDGDVVYDHPTALDMDGTLGRTLESLKIIENKDYRIIILLCPTSVEIEDEALRKVKRIVKSAKLKVKTYVFSIKDLEKIKKSLQRKEDEVLSISNLSLFGYSNVRNICLIASNAIDSDVTILIDDDELIEKKDFIELSTEFIEKHVHGKVVYGVAGYYLNKDNEFYNDVKIVPWMTYWNRFGFKLKAFNKIINSEPRIKKTPFVFGGAMVIHKNLFQTVPFDPLVKRGEDIDYLINSKMFGFEFFLDNLLNVKHMPPPKEHPGWMRFREDMYRFLYEQAKIKSQYEVNNMQIVTPEDFDPYPGEFLKDDLEDKIYKTSVLLALEYLAEGDVEGCKESLQNIYESKNNELIKINPFKEYRKYQREWQIIMSRMFDNRDSIRKIMEDTDVSVKKKGDKFDENEISDSSEITLMLKEFEIFSVFEEEEIIKISSIVKKQTYDEGEYIFKVKQAHNSLYFIVNGTVSIMKTEESKREVELDRLVKHDILGESLLVKKNHTVTAIAKDFCEILTIEDKDLLYMIKENPVLGNKILFVLLEKTYSKLDKSNDNIKTDLIQNIYFESEM
jgi:hypothetical protein